MIKPKKFLGQHFLTEKGIAKKIVDALQADFPVIEIGPGKGVLTDFLVEKNNELLLLEIDRECIPFLQDRFAGRAFELIECDCLQHDWATWGKEKWSIIGNFPYQISSPLFFKILTYKQHIPEVVCMIQKEVADRIAEKAGTKTYGILSVLLQTWYDVELLFNVSAGSFFPPPKVKSAVLRLTRNNRTSLPCSEKTFTRVVKQGFQNRRKTLRNALKILSLPASITSLPIMEKRAEQLTPEQFIDLTVLIEQHGNL